RPPLAQRCTEHPRLGAAVPLADSDSLIFTGRLSLRTPPWLADHAVHGACVLPGTAFADMALHAGDHVGCALVEEVTLQAPLVLSDQGATQLQLVVGAPGESRRRSLSVHSRPDSPDDVAWVRHADGVLAPTAPEPVAPDAVWPPPGAAAVDLDGFYERLADLGLGYGPTFRGLTAAWRLGDEFFGEVTLPTDTRSGNHRFGLHPALLDAALHPLTV